MRGEEGRRVLVVGSVFAWLVLFAVVGGVFGLLLLGLLLLWLSVCLFALAKLRWEKG